MKRTWAGLMLAMSTVAWAAEPAKVIRLWTGMGPGDAPTTEVERDLSKPGEGLVAGRALIRLGHVSQPEMAVYRPPAGKDTGAAVLVCPGGGYHILAQDLEGTEVCEWLNSIGVTGVVLKYRVPRRPGREPYEAPLQDAQRAMGMLRRDAQVLGIDPQRLGVLGFSAGGHLAATLSNQTQRRYPRVDGADDLSCLPDFAVLVYPAYLTVNEGKGNEIAKELPVSEKTPPTFVVIAQDDPVRVENALVYATELQRNHVPMELHVFPKGGHGYGLRRTELPVTAWPDLAGAWMRLGGWLKARP